MRNSVVTTTELKRIGNLNTESKCDWLEQDIYTCNFNFWRAVVRDEFPWSPQWTKTQATCGIMESQTVLFMSIHCVNCQMPSHPWIWWGLLVQYPPTSNMHLLPQCHAGSQCFSNNCDQTRTLNTASKEPIQVVDIQLIFCYSLGVLNYIFTN